MEQVLASNDSSGFWDRIAARYAAKPIADVPTYEKKLALTQCYLSADSRVLEFGCGTGGTAHIHAQLVSHVLATDYSEQMIAIARSKQPDQENIEFRQATFGEIHRADGPFDAILGLNVLHLVSNYRACIEQAHDLLSTGGIFVTSTVCLGHKSPLRFVLPVPAALGLVPRVVYIDAGQLETDVTTAGFEIVERLKAGRNLFLIGRKSCRD